MSLPVGTEFTLTFGKWAYACEVLAAEELGTPVPEPTIPRYPMRRFLQGDPLWGWEKLLNSNYTIRAEGCALCCAAMIASQVDREINPKIFNDLVKGHHMQDNGLLIWEAAADVIPGLVFDGPANRSAEGPLIWRTGAADMDRVRAELAKGPVIVQVDYRPGGKLNSHFVVAMGWTEDGEDIVINDPMDGRALTLLTAYGQPGWSLARTIYGLRLLRVAS